MNLGLEKCLVEKHLLCMWPIWALLRPSPQRSLPSTVPLTTRNLSHPNSLGKEDCVPHTVLRGVRSCSVCHESQFFRMKECCEICCAVIRMWSLCFRSGESKTVSAHRLHLWNYMVTPYTTPQHYLSNPELSTVPGVTLSMTRSDLNEKEMHHGFSSQTRPQRHLRSL